ncbi:MAG: aminopeptidase P family protein [Promethearchaeota archaeon]|nr:MAG: aminopeptidase P family protein [Candidatus Lokiarchaeota archaeon]
MSQFCFNYENRINKTRELLQKFELDFIIITNIQNLYWLSGTAQYGVLLLSEKEKPTLFVRRNYFKAKEETYLENLVELEKTSQIKDFILNSKNGLDNLTIGMELDSLPTSFYLYYKNMLKGANIKNIELDLRKLRMIKDKKELELFREAGKIAQKAQERIPDVLRPGIKEYEVVAEVVYEAMKNKSVHFSNVNSTFGKNWLILASGENLWTPSYFPILSGKGLSNAIPYGYSEREIKQGDLIMCDYAINYRGYHADHARTYFLESYPDGFKEKYLILKQIYEEIKKDYLKVGIPVSKIYNRMKELLDKEGLGEFFQGNGYYYQGLGHGIGLELDEPPAILPNSDIKLEENMVIALEPKIIIPEWGAIDLEDDFIIKKNDAEQITKTPYLFE